MKRIFILSVLLLTMVLGVFAQRKTDKLDRGLVAIKTNSGCIAHGVSWVKNTMTSFITSIAME